MPKRRITQSQADALERGEVVALTQEQFDHLKQFSPQSAVPLGFQPGGGYVLDGEPITYVLTWMHRTVPSSDVHIEAAAIDLDSAFAPPTAPVTQEDHRFLSYPELLQWISGLEDGIDDDTRDVSVQLRGSMLTGFQLIERKHPR
jgi:hypothetical protein